MTHRIRLEDGSLAAVTEPAHDASRPEGAVIVSLPPAACLVFPA